VPRAQPAAVHYVYDDLNRLVGVVDQQGNAATYTYDAVGNILRIDRSDASAIPGGLGITLVMPGKGRLGTAVEVFGKGFGATPAENTVRFNGALATVTRAAPNRLLIAVPPGATTGPITVTAGQGTATSPQPFVVLAVLAVTPTTATVFVQGTRQFQALETGGPATAVRWSVNGLPGGDTTVGTISDTGLYTAPAATPTPATVTVSASHTDDASLTASAAVTIWPPLPMFLTSGPVSVAAASPPVIVDKNVTASVSVVIAPPTSVPALAQSSVSVSLAPSTEVPALAQTAVSVAVEPAILSMTPNEALAGTSVGITLTGAGFAGATDLVVLFNNAADANVTVSNVVISTDGREATADLAIAPGAAVGGRVLRIVTPGGNSTPAGSGGNVFTVR
jgi:YD repeat-containing protein